jgi:lexA DNA binding domain
LKNGVDFSFYHGIFKKHFFCDNWRFSGMAKGKKASLSEKQSRLHNEICEFVRANHRCPTLAELGERLHVSANAVWYTFQKLRDLGYIEGEPHAHSWKIAKWLGEENGCYVNILGDVYDGLPIFYKDASVGQAWLPLQESMVQGPLNELFALRIKHQANNSLPLKSSPGNLLVFQRRKLLRSGHIILASLNRRFGLFKFSTSQTQTTLQQGMDEQSRIQLQTNDEFHVTGVLLMPFNDSKMQLS